MGSGIIMVGAPAAAYYKRAALGLISVSGLVYGTVAHAGRLDHNSQHFRDGIVHGQFRSWYPTTKTAIPTSRRKCRLVISINGTGGRSSLNLNYGFNQNVLSPQAPRADENRNSLAATGQVELWKRIFFVDGQAAISQVIEDGTEAASVIRRPARTSTGPKPEATIYRRSCASISVNGWKPNHASRSTGRPPKQMPYRRHDNTDRHRYAQRWPAVCAFSVVDRRVLIKKPKMTVRQPSEKERRVDGSVLLCRWTEN